MENRVDIGEVLRGLEIYPLEPGWTPTDVLCLVKCLENGVPTWAYRATTGLNREELLGVLRVHAALTERELVEEFLVDD